MKFPLNEYQRRSILPMAGIALAAYYCLVFVPLKRHARDLDAPLGRAWFKLSASLDQTNSPALDFQFITNQLFETQQARSIFESARQRAAARLELAPAIRARVTAPFQLVDFENERSKEADDLTRLAKQQQTTIEPAVFFGFPEHTVDVKRPELLWAALSLVDGVLRTALQCKVTAIHSLQTTMLNTNAQAGNAAERLVEIPLQLEFTAPAPSVLKFLNSLPLRGDELRGAGVAEAPLEKPPVFIDRLVIKKQSPDKPDEVRAFVRVVGFVLRESSPALD
jgi:hypothetical protein